MSQQEPRLKSARHIAAEVFAQTVREGDRVVDATLGTGQDCLLLCQLVGEGGKVYGFDVQQDALRRTQERLKSRASPTEQPCTWWGMSAWRNLSSRASAWPPSTWAGCRAATKA